MLKVEAQLTLFCPWPVFPFATHRVEVVATYGDGSIAALMSTYGKGRVAVCGPHPEARASWKDAAANGDSWVSSADLAVQFLKDLLSDRPLGK